MSRKRIPAEDTKRLLRSLMVISRLVEQVLENRPIELSDLPLSKSKVQVLRLLAKRGPQAISQFARHLGVTRPAVSQVVDSLESDALVKRTASKKDGRRVDISLTRKGREASAAIAAEQAQIVRSAIRRVSAEEAGNWIVTLESITAAIAQANPEFREFCLQCDAYSDDSCILVGGDYDCPYLRSHEKGVEQSPEQ